MRRKLITLREAAERLCIDKSSILKGLCGTDKLTRCRPGRKVLFIEDEVEALIKEWIRAGEEARPDSAVKRHFRVVR